MLFQIFAFLSLFTVVVTTAESPQFKTEYMFLRAAYEGDGEIIEDILSKYSSEIANATDQKNKSALMFAADQGHENIVKMLVAVNALDINACDDKGWSALDYASSAEIKELLIAHGAVELSPIVRLIEQLVESINEKDVSKMLGIVNPQDQVLQEAMKDVISKGMTFYLDVTPFSETVQVHNQSTIEVRGIYTASSYGLVRKFTVENVPAVFKFGKINGKWYLTSTDLVEQSKMEYWMKVFLTILNILTVVAVGWLILWMWMLIDCIRRDMRYKLLWLLALIFLGLPTSIIYYFVIKRRNIRRQPVAVDSFADFRQ